MKKDAAPYGDRRAQQAIEGQTVREVMTEP